MAHATGKPHEHVQVHIDAHFTQLSSREEQLLNRLIEAVKLLDPIFLDQMNQDLEETQGIFDKDRVPNFYPKGMLFEEMDIYLTEHPEEKALLMSPVTIVTRKGDRFVAEPYSVRYHDQLERISTLLHEAASFADDAPLKKFLLSKAAAFRTNEYRASDIDWVHVDNASIEITIGPYEVYEDRLFGVKTDFEGLVGVVAKDATTRAKRFQEEVESFDAALGHTYGYTVSTKRTPMVVIDEVYAGGSSLYRSIAMAYNLPNDRSIHKEVGSKKVFLKNVIEAKFDRILSPIAARVVADADRALLSDAAFMAAIIGHESAHGLSFYFEGETFRELGSLLEEAKADVFGLMFLAFLSKREVLPDALVLEAGITHVVDGLRQLRFGIEEAHASGALIQYNWLIAEGALIVDKKLAFDRSRLMGAFQSLGDAFYELSQGDYANAKAFVEKWGSVPVQLRKLIATLEGLPVDIDPVFSV